MCVCVESVMYIYPTNIGNSFPSGGLFPFTTSEPVRVQILSVWAKGAVMCVCLCVSVYLRVGAGVFVRESDCARASEQLCLGVRTAVFLFGSSSVCVWEWLCLCVGAAVFVRVSICV